VTAFGRPETRYVRVDGADVAYQVLGDGPVDLVYFYGIGSHIELFWDDPSYADFLRRLASFSRLIVLDRRGTGASDRVEAAMPTWEQSTDDLRAVLDAAGSERAAIIGDVDAGPIAVLFAAMQPARVQALVLSNSSPRFLQAPDYPIGLPSGGIDAHIEAVEAAWGTPQLFEMTSPGRLEEPGWADDMAKQNRAALTPRAAGALLRYVIETLDVREALGLVQAPTLVIHNAGNRMVPRAHGRYLAEHIPGARLLELDSSDLTWSAATMPSIVEAIAEHVTGEVVVSDVDRVLTTILFTDIVASTEHAARVGDARWRSLLDAHDRVVRDLLRRFRGREIKTTGDGFVASFPGPARAIACATAVTHAARTLGLEVRAGMHTGECEVRGDDIGGLAVHIAARVAAQAQPGETLVSRTVKDLVVGSGIELDDRGDHDLKGVPGRWALFAVRS
jgi:class 3 adenylate cyclase/pimeloyl-ACP methyl ester carboxylesterase